MNDKFIFGMFAIGAVTFLQIVAWLCGHNGQVFALTSAVIGGVSGVLLGIKIARNGGGAILKK